MNQLNNRKKLPGSMTKIISFIPMLNWMSLLILGIKCDHFSSVIWGILYGIVSFGAVNIAPYIWIMIVIHYSVMHSKLKKIIEKENAIIKKQKGNTKSIFLDNDIDGVEEVKQPIPRKTVEEVEKSDLVSSDVVQEKNGMDIILAQLEKLEEIESNVSNIPLSSRQVIINILIDKHRGDRPLKLSFALIEAMCDYSMRDSIFYKDGHQELVEEAIPRVIALADAATIKSKNKGILPLYGPGRTKKQICYVPQVNENQSGRKKVEVSVRDYVSSQKLRGYITEIVRYSENVLRAMYGSRGRLRGVNVDEETAGLIEAFLKKEYSPNAKKDDTQVRKIDLDFESIDELRAQSDAVRDALEVLETDENQETSFEEPDMDAPQDVQRDIDENSKGIFFQIEMLSDGMRQCVENLSEEQMEVLYILLKEESAQEKIEKLAEKRMTMPEIMIDEINEMATQYLDDILIDTLEEKICVLEQYEEELKKAMR